MTNTAIKKLDTGPPTRSDADCNKPDECRGLGECMNQTFLEVSWSRITPQIYAFTHLGRISFMLKDFRLISNFNLKYLKIFFSWGSGRARLEGFQHLHDELQPDNRFFEHVHDELQGGKDTQR